MGIRGAGWGSGVRWPVTWPPAPAHETILLRYYSHGTFSTVKKRTPNIYICCWCEDSFMETTALWVMSNSRETISKHRWEASGNNGNNKKVQNKLNASAFSSRHWTHRFTGEAFGFWKKHNEKTHNAQKIMARDDAFRPQTRASDI